MGLEKRKLGRKQINLLERRADKEREGRERMVEELDPQKV